MDLNAYLSLIGAGFAMFILIANHIADSRHQRVVESVLADEEPTVNHYEDYVDDSLFSSQMTAAEHESLTAEVHAIQVEYRLHEREQQARYDEHATQLWNTWWGKE